LADSPAVAPEHVIAEEALRHHFANMEQQRESSTLGMWVFLVTEIMFFGGLFAAYMIYRHLYPGAWATGSEHMSFWLGTINTTILLISSLLVALSVHAIQLGESKITALLLLFTVLLGTAFLGIKAVEYHAHYVEGAVPGHWWHLHDVADPEHVQMFFILYFIMTGLHALHVTIGLGLLAFVAYKAYKGGYTPEYHNPVEVSGLYWHFVDLVWIFLYPMLYLVARTHTG